VNEPAGITPINFALNLIFRLGVAVIWLTFAVFHLAVIDVVAIVLWCSQVSPASLYRWLVSIRDSQPSLWLGALGIGVVVLLALYVKLWRRIYSKLTTPYFFRGLARPD
jgi:hypothetical protein